MTESEFLLLTSNKINNYKLKNPLEYLNIIKEFKIYKSNRFYNVALIFRDFNINNINSSFSMYYGNTSSHLKDTVNITINFPSHSLFYIGIISINSNNNHLYKISTDTSNSLIKNKDMYDLYENTKDTTFRKIIDILISIDIMYLNHNNKSVYIKG